ncbi:chorismate mutase [Clostridium subterminale]|uniref:Chorismate mutase domain-containing protein n=1 Tax=Clostridium subterminale TaxID=1550 RepID=A0ABP3W3H5_CLOSU
MNELEQCRKEIDEIDKELINLFERRMDVAIRVANYKKENDLPIYNEERESKVIKKNVDNLKNKNYDLLARRFFLSVMELSRSLQESIIKKHK